jgi:hypothetical protein
MRRDTNGHAYFEPIGVWAHGPGLGLDIVMQYVPGNEDAQAIADGIINDLIERGERALPVDFLEQWQGRISLYRGDRSPIYATDAGNVDDVAECVLALIVAGKPLGDPPLA